MASFKAKFICANCGKEPEPDKKLSNENWKVAPKECPNCGGKIRVKLE